MSKTELQEIREAYGVSRTVFGKVFLGGVYKNTVYLYEKGKLKIPEHIMMLARIWKKHLDDMKDKKDEKVQD